MTAQAAQTKVLDLLSEIHRPGIDAVVDFIKSSNYLTTAQCHGHHRRDYGLMDKETLNINSPLTSIMKNAKNNERKPEHHKLCLTQERFC